jgi:hypothetical protein
MTMRMKLSGLAILVVAVFAVHADTDDATIARMRADLTFLASDACEGRGPGTAGIDKAADYIAAAFKAAGLKGGMPDGTFFQPFLVRGNPTLGSAVGVTLTPPEGEAMTLKINEQFQALGLSGSGSASGPIVFAGYGITCDKPSYDDYHGIDVAGKVVLLIRKCPRYSDKDHPFGDDQTVQQHAALAEKIANAEKHKAVAVILTNDASEQDDALIDFDAAFGGAGNIPAVQIKRSIAEKMLKGVLNKSLPEIEESIAKDLTPAGAASTGWTAKVTVTVERRQMPVKNVVGALEGAGPLAKETVVIGAHYDHLGYGGRRSGSMAEKNVKAIHHGADDNGSGTTALIELARRFGAEKDRQGRRLVFIAFAGEEMGLLGSKHYVDNPLFPLESTVAMVNMDMVGRLVADPTSGKGKLEVGGTGSAKEFDALIDKINAKHGFDVKKNKAGVGPSDHTSFYLKGVPVFFLFTGLHKQYHKPADTVDLINFAGMKQITDLAEDLTKNLATETAKPELVKGVGSLFQGGGRMNVPRIGFMPGNYDEEADGVLVGSVSKDGPAEKAGMKDGDRIVAIAGNPIKNMTAYMAAMRDRKAKQPIEFTVDRKGEKVKLTVVPQ